MAELMRLYRSLVKRGLAETLGSDGCQQFLRAYSRGDAALVRALLTHRSREGARLHLHALAWRIRGWRPEPQTARE
jgi:hypothetical protein